MDRPPDPNRADRNSRQAPRGAVLFGGILGGRIGIRRSARAGLLILLFGALSGSLPPGASGAPLDGDYAYLFVQGKIADPLDRKPLAGATVRLTADNRVFQTITDPRGVFVFEKLPVAPCEMEIITRDGRVIRRAFDTDRVDPERTRIRIRLGRGTAARLRIEPAEGPLQVTVPVPPTRWKKLWVELGVFLGVAGILAL